MGEVSYRGGQEGKFGLHLDQACLDAYMSGLKEMREVDAHWAARYNWDGESEDPEAVSETLERAARTEDWVYFMCSANGPDNVPDPVLGADVWRVNVEDGE